MNVIRQQQTRNLEGLRYRIVGHYRATVEVVGRNFDGRIGDGALHEPETCRTIIINDHLGHWFAQIAGIARDVAIGSHVEFGSRR